MLLLDFFVAGLGLCCVVFFGVYSCCLGIVV